MAGEQQANTTLVASYMGLLRRRWWLIAVIPIVAAAAAWANDARKAPSYQASTEALVEIGSGSAAATVSLWETVDPTLLANEIKYANSAIFRAEAERRLGTTLPSVRAEAGSGAATIVFIATGNDALAVTATADAFAKAFAQIRADRLTNRSIDLNAEVQRQIDRLSADAAALPDDGNPQTLARRQATQARIGDLQLQLNAETQAADPNGGVTVLNPATEPRTPLSPKPQRSAGLGFAAGLAVAFGAAFVLEGIDRRVRSETDLVQIIEPLPIVARVPTAEPQELTVAGAFESGQPFGEAFRTLRTSLQFLQLTRPLRVIQVTSATEGEGKSTVAANLACAMAASGTPVVLIDGDLRRPRQHRIFGVDNAAGLAAVMLREAALDEACIEVPGHRTLRVLPSGPSPANPADFLWPGTSAGARASLPAVVAALLSSGWQVVIDTPPVMPVADALTVARMVDGTVIVTQLGKTDRRSLQHALTSLRQSGANIVGVVVNRADSSAYRYQPTSPYAYTRWYTKRRTGAYASPEVPSASQDASEVIDLAAIAATRGPRLVPLDGIAPPAVVAGRPTPVALGGDAEVLTTALRDLLGPDSSGPNGSGGQRTPGANGHG